MRRRRQRSLGIDISPTRISLALAEGTPAGPRLIQGLSAALPPVGAEEDPFVASPVLLETLKSLQGQLQGHAPSVLSLWGPTVRTRLIELPAPMPGNIAQFARDELRQCVAVAREHLVCGHAGLTPTADGRPRILAVAADARPATRWILAMERARLGVQGTELAALALLRAVRARYGSGLAERNVMVLWARDAALCVCVFRDGKLDYLRTRDVAELGEATVLRRTLVEEARATAQFYDMEVLAEPAPWRILAVVDGDAGVLTDLATALQEAADGAAVEVMTEQDAGPRIPDAAGVSAVAVGLALGPLETASTVPCIDLTPPRIVQVQTLKRQTRWVAVAALGVCLLGAVLVTGLFQYADRTRRSLEATLAEQTPHATAAAVDRLAALETHHAELTRICRVLDRIVRTEDTVIWADVLQDLGQRWVPEVQMTQLTHLKEENGLTIRGLARNYAAVTALQQGLAASPFLREVTLAQTETVPVGTVHCVEYSLHCEVAGATGPDACLPDDSVN